MTCIAEYGPRLRAHGFRVTPQRMAILHVLRHAGGHLSPLAVYRRARRELPGLTLPTVYRTLEFLVRNEMVWRASLRRGHLAYELAEGNHHHLKCSKCGRESEIALALLEKAYAPIVRSSGFLLSASHITLLGLCPECQKTRIPGVD